MVMLFWLVIRPTYNRKTTTMHLLPLLPTTSLTVIDPKDTGSFEDRPLSFNDTSNPDEPSSPPVSSISLDEYGARKDQPIVPPAYSPEEVAAADESHN